MKDNLLFLHVPKCGGSSLRTAMAAHFPRGERYRFSPEALRGAIDLAAGLPKQSREAILLHVMLEGDHRFVAGHVHFSERGFEQLRGEWRFVTMLRNPVDRWFSSYFYKRHRPDHPGKIEAELIEYIETEKAVKLGRKFVRTFCGEADEVKDLEAAIDRARENLAEIDVVGVLEDQELFVARFQQVFGMKLKLSRVNESPVSREERDRQITDGIRARVEELCAPDFEVYRFAVDELIGRTA